VFILEQNVYLNYTGHRQTGYKKIESFFAFHTFLHTNLIHVHIFLHHLERTRIGETITYQATLIFTL
jgi:hypothetical protein